MSQNIRIPGMSLSDTELNSIDSYRKQKNTAVLTIMFTDIEGFTALTEEKGESYVHELHSQHDRILVEAIQEDNAGVVIKYIGDSIMAVFSEPTAAAEKALVIQRRLAAFNAEHPELDDLKVRIGLHMGQTVVENKMQVDLFGRHVNKASRIESLADGGHVYISYSVFDSAKTWLIDTKNADFKLHGSYLLKGIKKAEEIYEIYNTDLTKPQAPRKGIKQGAKERKLAIGAGIVLALAAVVFISLTVLSSKNDVARTGAEPTPAKAETAAVSANASGTGDALPAAGATDSKVDTQAKPAPTKAAPVVPAPVAPAEVFFNNFFPREPILDLTEPLATKMIDESTNLKQAITDIKPGRHVIHYVVSSVVHYFSEIEVKPGKNVITPKFTYSEMPGAEVNFMLGSKTEDSASDTDEADYFYYREGSLEKVTKHAKITVTVNAKRISETETRFDASYSVNLNGTEIAAQQFTIQSPMGVTERTYVEWKTIWADDMHEYAVKYSYVNNIMQISVSGGFLKN